MNWVGGARTRVRGPQKSDNKIQKEYFERKRLRHLYHSEVKRNDGERETSSKHKPVKVSQDVLAFQMQRKLNSQKEPLNSNNDHLVKVVNLDGKTKIPRDSLQPYYRGVNMFGRVNVVELPVSPIERHSVLSLSYTPPSLGRKHCKRVAPISRMEVSQSVDLFSIDQIQSGQNGCIDLFGKTIKKPVSNKRPPSTQTRQPYKIDSAPATRESYPMATTNDAVDLNNFPSNVYSAHYNCPMKPEESISEFSIAAGTTEPVSSLYLHQFRDQSADGFEMSNPLASVSECDIYPGHHSQYHMMNIESFSSSQLDPVFTTGKDTDTFEVSVIDSPESKRSHSTLSKDSLNSYLNEPIVDDSTYAQSPKIPISGLTQFLQTNTSHLNNTRNSGMYNKVRDNKKLQNHEKECTNSSRSNWSPCSVDNMKKSKMASGSFFTWPPRSFDSMLYKDERISRNDFENQRYMFPQKVASDSTSYNSNGPTKSSVGIPASSQISFLVSTGLDYSQQYLIEDDSLQMVSPDSLSSNGCGVHVSLGQTGSQLLLQRKSQPLLNSNIYKQPSFYTQKERILSDTHRYSPFVADVYPEPSNELKQSAMPIKEWQHSREHNNRIKGKQVTLGSDFSKRYNTKSDSSPTAGCPELLDHPIKRKQTNTEEVLKESSMGACHLVTDEDKHHTNSNMGLRYETKSGSAGAHQQSYSLYRNQSCQSSVQSVNEPSSSKYNVQVPLALKDQSNEDTCRATSKTESTLKNPLSEICSTENKSEFTTPKTFKCQKSPPTTADVEVEKLSSGQVTHNIKAIESSPVVIGNTSPVNANNGTKVLADTRWQQTVSSNLSGLSSINDNLKSSVQDLKPKSDTATASDDLQRGHEWRFVDTTLQKTPKIMKDSCCSPIVELTSHWSGQDCKNLSTTQSRGRSLNERYCLRSRTRTD